MTVAAAPDVDLQMEPLLPGHDGREGDDSFGSRQLTAALRAGYGSDLQIRLRTGRPTVIANFVTTLDGVVSYNTDEAAGGGEVSGFFAPDAFVMGLLRALSDVVLIGAGTLRAAPDQTWSARFPHPPSSAQISALREQLRLSPEPTTVVVSASGELDLAHRGLADPRVPVTIVTTDRGLAALRRQSPFGSHLEAIVAGRDRVEPAALIETLGDRGARLVLCEGGSHLFGQLVAAGRIDELFLTIAPQIAGRSVATPRLSMVEDTAFSVAGAPWSRLVDVRRSDSHLFTRYMLQEVSA